MDDTQWSGASERAAPIHRGRRFMVYRVLGDGDQSFVVKTPRPDGPESEAESLRHEYRLLRSLSVPGIARPFALEEQDGHPALLLEDAGPADLDRWLGVSPLDLRVWHAIAVQLARALAGIHRAGVIHGDVTPPNVVIDPAREKITLVDFDSAASSAHRERAPPSPRHEAALPYLAPERLGAIDGALDDRDDLYALGATLYRMLTGAPPSPAEPGSERAPHAPPSLIRRDAPRALDAIIEQLLAPSPERRYASAAEVLDDLDHVARELRSRRRAERPRGAPATSARAPTIREARARLFSSLDRARAGARAICVVAGPPGSGKTSLARTVEREVARAGGRTIHACFAARDRHAPGPLLAGFGEAIRAILRAREEDRALVRRRLRVATGARAAWLAAAIPELAELADVAPPARRRARDAPLGDLCAALSELASALAPPRAPLALVLDDLHAASAGEHRLVRGLTFAPDARRRLVFCTVRDDDAIACPSALRDTLDAMRAADPELASIAIPPPGEGERRAEIDGLVVELRAAVRSQRLASWLADATAAIDERLTCSEVYDRIAEAFLPELADVCALELFANDGTRCAAAAAAADPSAQGLLDARRRDDGGGPLDLGAPARAGPAGALGVRRALALPLRAGEHRLGTIQLARRSHRHYDALERAVALELARRAGLAIERARRYETTRDEIALRDEFLSIAAHELSTPVTSLKLGVEGIRSGLISDTPTNLSRAFRIADRQVTRLAQLIDALLSVSRIRAGTLELSLERVDLGEIVRDVVERLGDEATRAGSSIEVAMASSASAIGWWDRTRLDQVVTNLLSNAIKFGRGAPIDIEITADDDRARLAVRDRGIGIPPGELDEVIGRFVRGASSRHYGGLGLGLYIVRQIVDALEATLSIDSAPGQGSTFTIELPRGEPPACGDEPRAGGQGGAA